MNFISYLNREMKAAQASCGCPHGVEIRWISNESHFFFHLGSCLSDSCTLRFIGSNDPADQSHVNAVQMKEGGVGYLKKDPRWRDTLVPLVR